MSSNSERQQSLILHTIEPDVVPEGYIEGGYRPVVGLEVANKKLWLPGDHGETNAEEFTVPANLANRAADYVEKHYIDEETRSLYRNCHLGAAAMTGAGYLKWYDALGLASQVISRGVKAHDLAIGQWGAIGEPAMGAYHSMVGVKPGFALQTDGQNGPLSVVSHDANLAYYRANHGSDMGLYAPIDNNPHY
jgi:hypothetical protein